MTLREVLGNIRAQNQRGWLYLPEQKPWTLESRAEVFESEEVPPELENEPDAGVPEVAKELKLVQVLPVTVVEDVLVNARAQRPRVDASTLLEALVYYYEHDAFLKL